MKSLIIASALSTMTIGCVVVNNPEPIDGDPIENPAEDPGTDPGDDTIDQALVAEYRAALPSMGQLQASAPERSAQVGIAATGDLAVFPAGSYDIATGINGAVAGIVQVLDDVTSLPPTVFNSDTQELVWGPFPNDDGIGYVAAYIREAGEGADFRYEYALLRGIDNDVASLQPVIWGGATPDPDNDDHGVGVTLWDFEANRAFEAEHNADFESLDLDRGRFVALYGKGFDDSDPGAEVAFVVASFRDFVPADQPEAEPADLDYFYGRFEGDVTVDFLDWEASFDVDEPADGLAEDVGVRMAFLNEGTGRAEVDAVGGSLAEGEEAFAVECWNAAIEQSYLSFELVQGGETASFEEDGNLADCGLFTDSLSDLGVPSLDDVDPALRAALDQVARDGIPAE